MWLNNSTWHNPQGAQSNRQFLLGQINAQLKGYRPPNPNLAPELNFTSITSFDDWCGLQICMDLEERILELADVYDVVASVTHQVQHCWVIQLTIYSFHEKKPIVTQQKLNIF